VIDENQKKKTGNMEIKDISTQISV